MIKVMTKLIKRKDANEILKFVSYLNSLEESKKLCKAYFVEEMKGHDDWMKEYIVAGYYDRKKMWVTYKNRRLKKIFLAIAHEYKHFLQENESGHYLVADKKTKRFGLPVLCRMMNDLFVKSEFQADMWAGKVVKQYLTK